MIFFLFKGELDFCKQTLSCLESLVIVNAWKIMTEKYFPSPTLLLLQVYIVSNFDVSIIYNLPSIMFVTIAVGFSLATYLSRTFKRFKQDISIK